MTRNAIWEAAAELYGASSEYLWESSPQSAVLRHKSNRKWFALVMSVERRRLGLSGDGTVDVLNVKADPLMHGSLLLHPGILPGYHMHKGSWLSILLNGTVDREEILSLLDMSWHLTAPKGKKH